MPIENYGLQTLDTATPALLEQKTQEFDLNQAINTEKLVQQHYNNMDMREQSRLRNVAIAAAQVKPYLDSGDTEGALNFALNRQRQIQSRMGAGENIDDQDTQAFIDVLQKGDIQTAKGLVDSAMSLGFMTGALKPSMSSNSAIERIISQLMAENPDLSYSAALYQYQTGNRQGTRLDENRNIVPIGGAIDIKRRTKEAEATGAATGKTVGENIGQKEKQFANYAENKDILNQVKNLLDTATGSGLGAVRDIGAGLVGISTEGAKAAGSLKILAAKLTMQIPRMEGPQSDKDTALYKEAAGNLADSTLPVEIRKSALATMAELNEKYSPENREQVTQQNPPADQPTIPEGAVLIGSSGGKPIYRLPDGRGWTP